MRSHAGVAAKMFQILASESINIQAISTSEIKVSCLVATKYTELAVRALHDGFGLGTRSRCRGIRTRRRCNRGFTWPSPRSSLV